MRHQNGLVVTLSVLALGLARAGDDSSGPSKEPLSTAHIDYSIDNALCGDALAIVGTVSNFEFVFGRWRGAFKSDATASPALVAALKEQASSHDRGDFYAGHFDIDNDGSIDTLVVQTGSIRSVDIDRVFVLPSSALNKVQSSLQQRNEALNLAPSLNPGNGVIFTNGEESVPTEYALWHVAGRTLIVMKELYFAQDEQQTEEPIVSDALTVGAVPKQVPSADSPDGNPRLLVEMICKIRSRPSFRNPPNNRLEPQRRE